MPGRKLIVNLSATSSPIDGGAGGVDVEVESWSTSVTSTPGGPVALSGSPYTVPLPPGGAKSLFVKVRSATGLMSLTWNDGAAKTQTFDGGFAVFSTTAGPAITSATITGTGEIETISG